MPREKRPLDETLEVWGDDGKELYTGKDSFAAGFWLLELLTWPPPDGPREATLVINGERYRVTLEAIDG